MVFRQGRLFVLGLLIFASTSVGGFDLGKALSDAVDSSANKIVDSTANAVTSKINKAISSAIPDLAPTAQQDDGKEVDLSRGVIIFGYDGCPYCRKAYAFLRANEVDYQLMDIRENAKAARVAQENGIRGVPVIYVEGEKLVGFTEPNYRKLLQKHGKI